MPAAAAESGDFYSFQSTAQSSLPSGVVEQVWVDTSTTANGSLTVRFPAPWTYTGPSPAAQPVFNISGTGISGSTGVTALGELVWNVGSLTEIEASVTATGNYLIGSTSVAFPSLDGLAGFVSPASGTQAQWYATVSQSSANSLQPVRQNGTVTRSRDFWGVYGALGR